MSTTPNAKISSLELDQRSDLPSPSDLPGPSPINEDEEKYPYYLPDGLQVSYAEETSSWHNGRVYGLRPTTFILSIALASMTILAIVSAAVGGSLAAKAHKYGLPNEDSEAACKADQPHSISTVAGSSPSSIPQRSNTSCPTTNATVPSPTNECANLSPTYKSALSNATLFNVSCNTSFHDYNILGLFAYRFEDCMEACASFNYFQNSNTTCYGVTFNVNRPQEGGKGNCFLKDKQGINSTAINGVSSARLASG